jgi:uncharacterized protein (DUF58 family)
VSALALFALAALPLAALAFYLRAFPHRPLVYLMLTPAAMAIILVLAGDRLAPPVIIPFLGYDWHVPWPLVLVDGLVIAVAAVDLFTLPRRSHFSAERATGHIASITKSHPVTLTVANLSHRGTTAWIRDDADQDLYPNPPDFIVRLREKSRSTLHYNLRPKQRGAYRLDSVFIRVRSWMGFWQRILTYPSHSQINVYPDMKQLSEYAVLARTNRLSQIGVRRTRRIGQDHDFERLRDYTPDDNYKHIDWRATARRSRLTVKDFQSSQSQRLIFLVDCGRMMTNESAGISLLDHALNAMLMLSYVALRQGDSVGLLCFADNVSRYVPPRGGHSQMNHLLHAVFNRDPELVESRYDQAFLYLSSHCRKRALVVLITNLIDEVNAHQIEQYLASLVGRHLPLGVLLRDHSLFDAADPERAHGPGLFRAAAASDILLWRQQVLKDLQTKGVLSLDVFPEDMTAPLINQYLNVKARHLL